MPQLTSCWAGANSEIPVSETDKLIRRKPTRREIIKTTVAAILLVEETIGFSPSARANQLRISNKFSILNKKRPRRPYTKYIVLHTTEGQEKGSLNKIRRYGEAHYFVSTSGRVYRIIDKAKIARHCGRSMWDGLSNIDNYSIGVEVVGYHDRDINDAQYEALQELLRQLKTLYDIRDQNILTHSMVAYGRPNRFQSDNHRGRKRCGMIFARSDVRARLGLTAKPPKDLDVEAGRLKVGDKELFSFLFAREPEPVLVAAAGNPGSALDAPSETPSETFIIDGNLTAWGIAREQYNHPSTSYVFPNGRRLRGDQILEWDRIPIGTLVMLDDTNDSQSFEGFREIGKDGDTSREIAGAAFASSTTIYFFPDGLIRTGAELNGNPSTHRLLNNPPNGTKVLVGYIYGGYVKTRRPPSSIAGVKWNYPSTYYRFPDDRILSGDEINAGAVPAGTLIFYER